MCLMYSSVSTAELYVQREEVNLQHLPGQSLEGKRVTSRILGATGQVFWLQVHARWHCVNQETHQRLGTAVQVGFFLLCKLKILLYFASCMRIFFPWKHTYRREAAERGSPACTVHYLTMVLSLHKSVTDKIYWKQFSLLQKKSALSQRLHSKNWAQIKLAKG